VKLARRVLRRFQKLQVVFGPLDGGHEDAEPPVARLDGKGGAHGVAGDLLIDPRLTLALGGGDAGDVLDVVARRGRVVGVGV
jgi:hypothetical protein